MNLKGLQFIYWVSGLYILYSIISLFTEFLLPNPLQLFFPDLVQHDIALAFWVIVFLIPVIILWWALRRQLGTESALVSEKVAHRMLIALFVLIIPFGAYLYVRSLQEQCLFEASLSGYDVVSFRECVLGMIK